MAVTEDTVQHYAKLASLHFTDEETKTMTQDLGTILDYVAKISELDTGEAAATDRMLIDSQPLREDKAGESLGTRRALANAPDKDKGHFLVPKMINK